jgi:hypothetical protein
MQSMTGWVSNLSSWFATVFLRTVDVLSETCYLMLNQEPFASGRMAALAQAYLNG